MIKIFIGHFNCLPDNPYVFAGDLAQVGEGGVRVLREVDSGLGRTGGGASGVGRLPDSVVLGGSGGLGGAEFPRSIRPYWLKWQDLIFLWLHSIPFNIHTPHFIYPFICQWALRLFP